MKPKATSAQIDENGNVHESRDVAKGGVSIIGTIGGEDVRQASDQEHNLTFTEALKLYPTAVGWSTFFSLGIIMYADAEQTFIGHLLMLEQACF